MEHGKGDEGRSGNCSNQSQSEEEMDLRRGPWTVEEDFTLINYIAHHGEGRWNSLARCAGLKRTGKSCRLRWLNYLRPDVRRGNITLEEQLMILELHSRWGNRWSKIAQHLPGRTDNEIKNYWRTRVQKHAKQLKCDVNSKQFKDTMRYLWMPRLVERIQAAAAAAASSSTSTGTPMAANQNTNVMDINHHMGSAGAVCNTQIMHVPQSNFYSNNNNNNSNNNFQFTPENSCTAMAAAAASSDSFGAQVSPVSDLTDCYNYPAGGVNQSNHNIQDNYYPTNHHQQQQQQQLATYGDTLTSPTGKYYYNHGLDFQEVMEQQNHQQWMEDGGDDVVSDSLWNVEDVWFLQQQLGSNNI